MPVEKSEDNSITIKVPSKDEEKGKSDELQAKSPSTSKNVGKGGKKKGLKGKDEIIDEMSEEDKILKEGLEVAVLRLQESDTNLHKAALDHLAFEIKTATSSMTSVPKPLKFLRPHYDSLKAVYQSWSHSHPMKKLMADIMSVLGMTMAPSGTRECLKFKLQGTNTNISSWGHEYVRSLSGEISEEYNHRSVDLSIEEESEVEDLLDLVNDIVPFQMSHNAEAEAVDLLMEVQQLGKIVNSDPPVVDETNFERVCLYLLRSAEFVSEPEDLLNIFTTDALRVALKMGDSEFDKLNELFSDETGATLIDKKQMALILARHKSPFEVDDEEINIIICNTNLSERFLSFGIAMDAADPKTPEDIYKISASGSNGRGVAAVPVLSARANLANSFVNGFVNAGFCNDTLMTGDKDQWVKQNKDNAQISAVASLGLVMLWNFEEAAPQLDKYIEDRTESNYIAGACLGYGIASCGIRDKDGINNNTAILCEHLESTNIDVRIGAISGLGIACAGHQRKDLIEVLAPFISRTHEEGSNIAEVSLAALSLGMIFAGSCNCDIGDIILSRLMEITEEESNHTMSRYLCLGLGALFLGKQDKADVMIETVRVVEHKIGKYAEITLQSCAYAGSGNVLKIQSMLHICAEHLTENAEHQAVAVLGIGLISIGEDIGTDMTLRTFEHLLHYGELPVKRVVPLAIALLYISNPDYAIIDQLSRLSHDQDLELSQSAIFGLGLVSAGCNNSRVSGLLRSLSDFYAKEANHLFAVRIAQGLNCLGKGLIGLSPFHSDRLLMNASGMIGILTVLHACFDMKGTIFDKFHYLLYFLTTSMNPRILQTCDENLAPIPQTVRVGLAVETVGQAGRPKTITGFQTHTTPVLLGYKDRAELANRDYFSFTSVIEGMVILEKTPEEVNMEN